MLTSMVLIFAADSKTRADEPLRTWRDAGGIFSIEASLVEAQADVVKLRKKDGNVIQVPVSKLSEADREFIKGSSGNRNRFESAGLAKVEPLTVKFSLQRVTPSSDIADLPAEGNVLLLSKGSPGLPLEADPFEAQPSLAPSRVAVAQTDPYDDISDMVTLNSRQAIVAISIGRLVAGREEPPRGRVLVGQLPKGPFQEVIDTDQSIKLFDHHAVTGQTFLVSGLDVLKRGGEIVILEGLAEGKPVELYRRRLPGYSKPGFKPTVGSARLIAKDIAIVIVDSDLYCWNLRENKLIYRAEPSTVTSSSTITLSGTGKWLALPQTNGFSLLNAATGEDLGFVETNSPTAPGVAFRHDGRRIAFCSSNSWGVWDIESANTLVSGITTEHLGDKLTGWIGNDLFLTESGNVIDTKMQMLVWHYYTGASVGKKLWNNSLAVLNKTGGLQLETLAIPDPKAQVAIRRMEQQKNLMVTAPGTEVRIAIESTEPVNKEELTTALTQAIERAEWKISPAAKLTVVAKIGRGKPYQLQYTLNKLGTTGGGETHTVEVKPFTATLEIRAGNNVLWTRHTENHVPSFLFMRGNETIEQAVRKFERPQPEFFASLQIPPRIPKAELAKGFGASRLDKGAWVDFQRPR
jgi:hypothetical protein